MKAGAQGEAEYCRELVKRADPDHYLATLLAPADRRRALFALHAFDAEIARVRDAVSEPAIGEIRLQWWHDALAAIGDGQVPDAPVARELAHAVRQADLSPKALQDLLEARRFDLYDDPMPGLNDLEGYLRETVSLPIQMAAMIVAQKAARNCAEVSGLAGVACGLAGLLRALPLHRARGQCYVPAELLAEHGLTPAHVIAGRDSPAMATLLQALCDRARQRLEEARELQPAIPAAARPAFLPVALVEGYLHEAERLGTGILATPITVSQVKRQWWLMKAAVTGRF